MKRLNNLLCRLVRRHLKTPRIAKSRGFKVTPNGYKYKDKALFLVSRRVRKRVCLPLKDDNISDRQLYISVCGNTAVVVRTIEVKPKASSLSDGTIYIHVGYKDMLTLSNGNVYGENLNLLVTPETERLDRKNRERGHHYQSYVQSQNEGKLSK